MITALLMLIIAVVAFGPAVLKALGGIAFLLVLVVVFTANPDALSFYLWFGGLASSRWVF